MKKILILIIIGIAVVIGYFYIKPIKTNYEIQATPSPASETKSKNFKSDILGFEVTLPEGLVVEEKSDGKVAIIGDKILVYELDSDPEKCTGVCSVLTKKEDVEIAGIKARYLEGYWEELGSDNAQSFVSFVIPRKNKYLVFMLQELPITSEFVEGRKIGVVGGQELTDFKDTVNSVKLH